VLSFVHLQKFCQVLRVDPRDVLCMNHRNRAARASEYAQALVNAHQKWVQHHCS
jgi:hypothetical protein